MTPIITYTLAAFLAFYCIIILIELALYRKVKRFALEVLIPVGALALSLGIAVQPAGFAAEENAEKVLGAWTAGLGSLSPEEEEFLRGLAQERLAAPTTKGSGSPPGARSEIVRNPLFFDYAEFMKNQGKDLDARAMALVKQDRFYYLETGVTIEKGRFESIDALIFELAYEPDQVSTFSQLPDRTTEAILTVGGDARLALGADLKVAPAEVVFGKLQAKVTPEAGAKVYAEGKRTYTLEKVLVTATGERQPWSRWIVNSSGLIKDDVSFIGVLRVPKALKAFKVRVKAVFIDKLLFLERSRSEKKAAYSCRTTPLRCVVSGK